MDNEDKTDNIYSAPTADLGQLTDNHSVKIERIITQPLSPRNLRDLFFSPTRFFAANTQLNSWFSTFFMVLIFGFGNALDRLDSRINNAYILNGDISQYAEATNSWSFYIGSAIGSGLVLAIFSWLILGWWYKTRIRFCGVSNPDPIIARELLFYSHLPYITFLIVVLIVSIIRFDNYADEFYSEGDIYTLPLYFLPLLGLIWSISISYIGVKAKFNLYGLMPMVWFLILPLLFYLIIFAVYFFFLLQ